jgi:sigma-B regulation protein RsbQ
MKFRKVHLILLLVISCFTKAASRDTLAYNLEGKGTQTLLFVHGWCIDQSYWQNQGEEFKNEYKILTIDLAGHGKSKHIHNDYSIKSYSEDIAKLIKKLDLYSIILIGHSMGGDIILRVQSLVPKRIIGFLGIDNFLEVGRVLNTEQSKEAEIFFQRLKKNYEKVSEEFAKAVLFSPSTDTSVINRVISDIKKANQQMAVNTLRSLSKEGSTERELFSRMKLKTYLIVSDYNKVNEASLKKYIRAGYEIRYIKQSGHYPMIEKPVEFNSVLKEVFLKFPEQK